MHARVMGLGVPAMVVSIVGLVYMVYITFPLPVP
jgi:hypothetical protein